VALELRSNVEEDCQGVPGRYILHRVGPCTKVDKRKALIGCLSWHRLLCGEDAHTISIRMVWVKCTTSAECKSIWIGESSVMDSWDDHYLAQYRFWFYKLILKIIGGVCSTEYSEGTAMARWSSGYLEGTIEELEMVMCDWPSFMNGDGHVWLTWFMSKMGFPLPRDFY
jgi:hypothetical protein